MLDVSGLLEKIKASPYEEITICAPHCGIVSFSEDLTEGLDLCGPTGAFKEKPGTKVASIVREKNTKAIFCHEQGELIEINKDLDGVYVEAGEVLMRFRHFLSRKEVEEIILKEALHLFRAPERAKYYFIPAVDIKVKVSGSKSVTVKDGEEIFIQSRMKREAPLRYQGPEGIIYAVYFDHNENVDAGQPLIGICPPELVESVEEVVMRVNTEWKERC